MNHASQEGSGDRSLFSSALGYINQNKVGCTVSLLTCCLNRMLSVGRARAPN